MKKKITTFEFITAFVVMSIFIYIFIRSGNREVIKKMSEVDSTFKVTNQNIGKLNDSFNNFYPILLDVNNDIKTLYFRQTDNLDMTINNSRILRTTNEMIEKNFDYLSIINQKQDMILKELKSQKKIDTIFIENLVDKK